MSGKGTLLFVGNFLSAPRHNKNVWHFLTEKLAENGWFVITTSTKEKQFPRLVDMLHTSWQKKNSYQVANIDVFSGKAFIYTILSFTLLKCMNKAVVLTLHGGGLPDFANRHPRLVRKVLAKADAVVTPSAFLKLAFDQTRPDIRLIPNPLNLHASIYRERKKAEPRLVWVRAFHATYNPTLAVKVLRSLSNEYPEIDLCMLGPDKGDGSLRDVINLSEELLIAERLHITGQVSHDEVPNYLNERDIFINTSNYDNAPSSLLEAMANGMCVVSTNVGGIPYLLKDGVDSLLVPPNDPQAMSDAIRRILTEPGLARKLSRNARESTSQLDWSLILPQWEVLFTEVVERKQSGLS